MPADELSKLIARWSADEIVKILVNLKTVDLAAVVKAGEHELYLRAQAGKLIAKEKAKSPSQS